MVQYTHSHTLGQYWGTLTTDNNERYSPLINNELSPRIARCSGEFKYLLQLLLEVLNVLLLLLQLVSKTHEALDKIRSRNSLSDMKYFAKLSFFSRN